MYLVQHIRVITWVLFALNGILVANPNNGNGTCNFHQSFEDAIETSSAIFLGRALEERREPISTKGATELGYREVKFEVTQSWRLVDKRYLWVRIPAESSNRCGFKTLDTDYLVYANRLNDVIYVSPLSRTMIRTVADRDIDRLGGATVVISEGEFSLSDTRFTVAASIIAFAIIVLIVFVFLIKRQ